MRLHYLGLLVNKKISKQALPSGTLSVFGLEGKRKKEENEALQPLVEKSAGTPKTGGSSWGERSLSEGAGSTSWMVLVSRRVSAG